MAARQEVPDPSGAATTRWPHDDILHAWWVEPGAVLAGEYPGDRDDGRARQKIDLLVDAGIRTFVDLTTPADRLASYDRFVVDAADARRLDLRHERFLIPDLGVVDAREYDRVVELIQHGTEHGGVYVHCWGGIGRTGTVIGCYLGAGGARYDEVVARISSLRAGTRKVSRQCPEMDVQHRLLQRRLG